MPAAVARAGASGLVHRVRGCHFGRDSRVRVVGATGAVGKEIVGVLEKRGAVLCPPLLTCLVSPCDPAAIKMRACVCMLDA